VAPVLVAFFTDHIFRDEVRVGDSLAIVCAAATLGAAIMLSVSLRAYRRLLDRPIALTVPEPSGPGEEMMLC
jgi:hypothetical protein